MRINATELMQAAKLVKSKRVPPDTDINIFHPNSFIAVAEWLVDAPDKPTGKKWVRYEIASGREYIPSKTDNLGG